MKIDRPDENVRVEMMHLSVNERGRERLRGGEEGGMEGGGVSVMANLNQTLLASRV